MTIKLTVDLPSTTDFVEGTPLELAGRVYAPLGGKAWEAAMGMFMVQWGSRPLSYAIEAGLRHGVTLLPEEDQGPVTAHMMRTLDGLRLGGIAQKVAKLWSFRLPRR